MNKTPLARHWLVVTLVAAIGLLIGVLAAYVLSGRPARFAAQATLAMLPGAEVSPDQAANFWEVLNRGQATRSAAIVFEDNQWLAGAASAAGVSKSELTLSAGAIPNSTLITVTMQAGSARAAELALDSVLKDATGPAGAVSGPFNLDVVASPDGSAHSLSPKRVQTFGALSLAGLLVGAGAGLLVNRSALERSTRRRGAATKPKHERVAIPEATDTPVAGHGTPPLEDMP